MKTLAILAFIAFIVFITVMAYKYSPFYEHEDDE